MKYQLTSRDLETLEKDYSSGEVSREAAEKFPLVGRGSVRLVRGLYRTESEQQTYVDAGLALRLPGQLGYRGRSWIGRLWDRLGK